MLEEREKGRRPLLILDLDETLMHAREEGFERAEDFQIGPYLVYKRPYFEAFLQRVQQSFSLAVWTSSGADYAREAVQNLFLEDIQLEFVWTSERCTSRLNLETFEQYWIKDLRKVKRRGYSLERVLMLDDSPEKLERHYGNWLPIPAFEGNSSDTALLDVLPFLEHLATLENVRKVEKRFWRSSLP